jgi:ergothioneine biosynthesis protein EgtB
MSILESKYKAVRSLTRSLFANLSAEDQMVQSCPEANCAKWHQAHTTWFFETFVLRPFLVDYKTFREELHRLFNSYYISLGGKVCSKKRRTSFSRPSLDEVLSFRAHVDHEMERLLSGSVMADVSCRIMLGLDHEQRHQELALADIKHAFFSNPLGPSYGPPGLPKEPNQPIPQLRWLDFEGGLSEVGYALGSEKSSELCFNNETPRHKVYLEPFQMANRLITCREYLEFVVDDGYSRQDVWLPEGRKLVKRGGWLAPLYWEQDLSDKTRWRVFTLKGWHELSELLDTPVCHISFFEADAFARWRHSRLPTESEWESVASEVRRHGNLLDTGRLHPARASGTGVEQIFGDCWEWTASSYTRYPGYKEPPGLLGEYDGKYMPSHIVLRGGSCVTAPDHARVSYRNSLAPGARWQFSGIRLAN